MYSIKTALYQNTIKSRTHNHEYQGKSHTGIVYLNIGMALYRYICLYLCRCKMYKKYRLPINKV